MSDWYAYYVMLMQSLLFVGPYGGVFKPKDKTRKVPHDARPLHGISVWDKQVRYPKPAKPLDILPDSFQNSLRDIFVEGKRESRKNIEPLTLTLFWIPKTSIAAEELCQLIADHGYKATRHYIPNKPKARGPFTASD